MFADLILTNARVLTQDRAQPEAEAVALADGRIMAVGTQAEVAARAGHETRMIDAAGRTVLPGFVESHLHLALGGAELAHLQLGGVTGADAIGRAFHAFATANPDAPLLMAQGGNYGMIGHAMTRADLDAIIPDRPIAVTASDHHTVWANTAALKAAGILHGASTPPGHEIVIGPDGMATGELREFEAFAPVIALGGEERLNLGIATGRNPQPWPDDAALAIDRAKVARGLAHCARHGITSMVNMDGNRYTLALLDSLRKQGGLTARVKVPFHYKPDMTLADLDEASALHHDFADDWLTSGMVKFFMDGVIDSRTAFMLQDYVEQPGWRSAPLFPDFAKVATEVDRRGLQIAVHAIGDGAVRHTIDGIAAAQRANGARDARHRIEHIELIDRAEIPRLATLGITASSQPPHAPGAMDFGLEPTCATIGAARLRDAFLCRTLAEAGAHVAFASDWPVTDVAVLRGIGAALTRPVLAGGDDQRVNLEFALRAYTAGGAWAAHRDHLTGTIRPGMAGDLVMLSGDIQAAAPGEIDRLQVAMTVCGGRVTFGG